ncbi:BMP family ABC transporter substrate-binding protein [Mumia sp. zg.B53]|uniref:BMP family lipoprotein n=1 Tax=Mumia sp. zg.B53 TaxID=2855449 RepID=UPI001C6F2281|nr:BMP family ABC transporter substrate-binding protein [Mumia sp. zg.B53]MBW9213798.1 BMP family ABC transporter substrate-binding protein [Mumia sp. zg.B53]
MGKITALAAVAALALAGCGSDDDSDDDTAKSGGNALDCAAAKGDGPNVGIAYDVGGQGDKSFNDAAAVGVKKAVDELDATCTEAEAQDGEAESAREDRLRQLADGGHNPILAVGFLYSESVNKVAPDYPEVNFDVVDGFDPDDQPNENVAYLGFAEEQGSFLVGAAAALKSKTGTVGFVGGVNSDLINKFEAGYVAGAKQAKPDIKVQVKYIEESDASGFNDPAGGKAAATGMFDQGADVVYHAAGGSGAGVFQAAVEAGDGMWAIGVDSDQWLTASKSEKPHILTSMLKRVDVASFDAIKAVDEGKPLVGYKVYDLKSDGVGYATSGGYVDDIEGELNGYADEIKSGKIKVSAAP